jgi:hypothetical protein
MRRRKKIIKWVEEWRREDVEKGVNVQSSVVGRGGIPDEVGEEFIETKVLFEGRVRGRETGLCGGRQVGRRGWSDIITAG